MKSSRFNLVVISLALVLATPAGAGSASLKENLAARNYQKTGPANWIKYHLISDWSELDDKHVIINAGESGDFLLTLRNACKHLDPSMNVSFSATAGNVTSADRIVIKGPGGFSAFCYISSISRLKKTTESDSG